MFVKVRLPLCDKTFPIFRQRRIQPKFLTPQNSNDFQFQNKLLSSPRRKLGYIFYISDISQKQQQKPQQPTK